MEVSWPYFKRFLSRVLIPGEDACWEWTGQLNIDGYGETTAPDGSFSLAHRLAWRIKNNAEIPDGMCVLHSCDNPKCVNPSHLSLGDQAQNIREMMERGRASFRQTGSRNGNSKLKEEDVREIKRMIAEGTKRRIVAARFKISAGTVDDITHGLSWAHV